MSQDTMFWVFSTISQTMAALIAVVGVVVVFRIDSMSRSVTRLIDKNLDSLEFLKGPGALRSEAESMVKFVEHYDKHEKQDLKGNDKLAIEGKVVRFWRSSEKRFAEVKATLKWFFVYGIATTGLCLVLMPFTKLISSCSKFSIFLVGAVLVCSTVTLVKRPIRIGTSINK